MACCVLIAALAAALLAVVRPFGGKTRPDPRAWRLLAEKSDD